MYKSSSPAFVLPSGFTDNNQMSCEGSARSPAPHTLSVAAGDEIDVFWEGATSELRGKPGAGALSAYNPWVHAMGFVIDYLTPCNGPCTSFDATDAGWTKIAHAGMDARASVSDALRGTMQGKPEPYYPARGPGLWAMAKLVQNGSKWSIKIPAALKSGQYLLRHELSAVHNPRTSNPTTGPQLYIACIQLDVTGGGQAALPKGTQARSLYDPNGAFANINVLSGAFDPARVQIPGPPVWDGASASAPNAGNGNGGGNGGGKPADKPKPTTNKPAATNKPADKPKTTAKAPAKAPPPPPAAALVAPTTTPKKEKAAASPTASSPTSPTAGSKSASQAAPANPAKSDAAKPGHRQCQRRRGLARKLARAQHAQHARAHTSPMRRLH